MPAFLSAGFLSAPLGLAYHVVVALSAFLSPLGGGLATAVAIVVFTIGVRLLLSPLSYHALRGQARLTALQPKVAELRKRYPGQPEKLQQELTALYRAEGSGLLAGCLPLLAQLPFFSIMYRLFLSATVAGRPNTLLARNLLTTPLGSHWLTAPGPASAQGLLFLGLFALLAGTVYIASRLAGATRPAGPAAVNPSAADGQPGSLRLLGRVLPYATVAVAAFVPLAAGLYLLTSTAWTAAERALLRRWTKPPAR